MGAGLISGGTAAAMTAIDGGSTKDIVRSATIGFATGAVINKLFSSGMCFVEGTAVLTEDGALAIEAVAVGMLVYAYDGATGDVALKPVMQLFRNETNELTTVETSDGQEIISTPTHPYYTVNRGWLAAKDLRAGDILLLVNGKTVVVEYIQHEILEAPVNVYNFEVADYHTYYVAESVYASADQFVLVHNKCGDSQAKFAKIQDGSHMNTNQVLDMAEDYLGPGYRDMGNGRFLSADGVRQVRMGTNDLLGAHGGGPHINFDILDPSYITKHIYFH